jgi:2-succinyl-6-hydroxy-2,4-cyclohexadiene-1-carboxylate synthase
VLHVEVDGNPDGVPMVLLHGFLSSNHQWDLNRERLGAVHRLYLVELLGHGRSQAPDDADAYRPATVLAEIDRVREAHGIARWWVVGQSFGGAIAARYCLAHPGQVLGFVFTNSRAMFGGGPRPSRPAPAAPDVAIAPAAGLRALPIHPIHATRIPPELQARMVVRADEVTAHVVDHIGVVRHDWRCDDELHRLSMPTLLVNGRWEKAFQPFVEQARRAVAGLEVVSLEGGHSINIEQPEGFDRAVLAFTSR